MIDCFLIDRLNLKKQVNERDFFGTGKLSNCVKEINHFGNLKIGMNLKIEIKIKKIIKNYGNVVSFFQQFANKENDINVEEP